MQECRAAGYLVFPLVIKVGVGVGGETGKGALIVGGKTVDYYRQELTGSALHSFCQLTAMTRSLDIRRVIACASST